MQRLARLHRWHELCGAEENQIVLNRGKGNSGADATKGQGRHQRAGNPKAQVSGLVENRNSFLTRADEKSLPIIKTVRLGEGVWRMMYFVSPSQ